jgi:hypothetical protein
MSRVTAPAKLDELEEKYDLARIALCEETRFKIVEIMKP